VTKRYLVDIADAARADIRSTHEYIAGDNPRAADRWLAQVERMILRLETFPFAHEVVPEAADLGIDYRHNVFGNYRIIYRVESDRVIVLRVIHGARLLDQSMFFEAP
jgi:toxin ParE1/3/4